MLVWIYSGDVEMPDDVFEIIELYFLAKEYKVPDLEWRCEEEIIMKLSVTNVVDVLTTFFKEGDLDPAESDVPDDEGSKTAEEVSESYKNSISGHRLSTTILNHCKSLFLNEFQEVYRVCPDVEMKIMKVPGLMVALFLHINE